MSVDVDLVSLSGYIRRINHLKQRELGIGLRQRRSPHHGNCPVKGAAVWRPDLAIRRRRALPGGRTAVRTDLQRRFPRSVAEPSRGARAPHPLAFQTEIRASPI